MSLAISRTQNLGASAEDEEVDLPGIKVSRMMRATLDESMCAKYL